MPKGVVMRKIQRGDGESRISRRNINQITQYLQVFRPDMTKISGSGTEIEQAFDEFILLKSYECVGILPGK